jgi:hypothetical protein
MEVNIATITVAIMGARKYSQMWSDMKNPIRKFVLSGALDLFQWELQRPTKINQLQLQRVVRSLGAAIF